MQPPRQRQPSPYKPGAAGQPMSYQAPNPMGQLSRGQGQFGMQQGFMNPAGMADPRRGIQPVLQPGLQQGPMTGMADPRRQIPSMGGGQFDPRLMAAMGRRFR